MQVLTSPDDPLLPFLIPLASASRLIYFPVEKVKTEVNLLITPATASFAHAKSNLAQTSTIPVLDIVVTFYPAHTARNIVQFRKLDAKHPRPCKQSAPLSPFPH